MGSLGWVGGFFRRQKQVLGAAISLLSVGQGPLAVLF